MLKLIDLGCLGELHTYDKTRGPAAILHALLPVLVHPNHLLNMPTASETNFGLLHDHNVPCLATVIALHADSKVQPDTCVAVGGDQLTNTDSQRLWQESGLAITHLIRCFRPVVCKDTDGALKGRWLYTLPNCASYLGERLLRRYLGSQIYGGLTERVQDGILLTTSLSSD